MKRCIYCTRNDCKRKKFKFLSFVRFMPDFTWVADDNKPGVANGYDLNLVTKQLKSKRKMQTI